jgi:thiamine transport system substrate-binding protein
VLNAKGLDMQRRFFISAIYSVLISTGTWVGLVASSLTPQFAHAAETLRVMTHSSFDLPKDMLAGFEQSNGVKLQIIKGGDAGEMLNKLILTKASPVADVVYGIDNTLLPRALSSGIVAPYSGPSAKAASLASMVEGDQASVHGGVVPIDYGFVTLNIDKAWFANNKVAMPKTLQDLAKPAYKNLLVMPHPATSSTGQAFMLATIAGLGETAAFDWWKQMRANGLKVVKGWSEAYYTEFSRNGGTRPMVVSYATSPAAEVFYSEKKIDVSPTANLLLKGGVFRQVEGAALIQGGNPRVQSAAVAFVEFLRSKPVQAALQTSMWMYPVTPGVPHAEVMKHAEMPKQFEALPMPALHMQAPQWQQRWVQVVLK